MALDINQKKICTFIDTEKERLLSTSHQIHARPELGNQEIFASGLLAEMLEGYGFKVERNYLDIPTAFRACKTGRKERPRVSFLAEYDALPGVGHGCGHNVIATASLGAGIGLGAVIAELEGEVCVIGTPAEETTGAKVTMVRKGAFQDIDLSMMIHPYNGNYYVTEALAVNAVSVRFKGRPSHAAASPWDGLNALDAMILLFNNIGALRQQLRPDARIHGVITNGGAAANIIPDLTEALFNVRAMQRDYLNSLMGKFKDCARAAALATGTELEVTVFENGYDNMVNNLTLAERFRDHMVDHLGSEPFQRAPDSFGSIDMGNVSKVVPAVHILINITEDPAVSLHTEAFKRAARTPLADQVMLRAAKGLALTAYDALTDAKFLQSAWAEFKTSPG